MSLQPHKEERFDTSTKILYIFPEIIFLKENYFSSFPYKFLCLNPKDNSFEYNFLCLEVL